MSAPEIAELLPATHVRPQFTGWLMRIVVPAAMVLTMIAASIGISTWAFLAQRDEALRRADDLIASLEARIRTQVSGYLAPVAQLTRIAGDLFGAGALAPAGEPLTEAFARGVLARNAEVATAIFAGPDGDFLMYLRNDAGGVDTKRIARDGEDVRTTWIRRDAAGEVVATETVPDDGYDPRTRPWYRGATDAAQPFWTDVYVFFTSRQPGVTVSLPVIAPDGEVAAVYGMDITLASLSAFLAGLEVGRSGSAMIVAEDGRLVAFPEASRLLVEDGDGLRSARITELDDPVLTRAWNRFRVEGPGRRVMEVNGKRYLNTASSLAGLVGRPWSVMLVAPESDFTLVVEDNYRTQLLFNLGVLAIAALLAVLVVNQGLRADRIERRARHREQQLARQTRTIGELVNDPGLHDPDDLDALQRLTEGVAAALGVARVSLWRWRSDRSGLDCKDCYDRRSNGHTDGAELLATGLSELMTALEQPLAVLDPVRDERTRALAHTYLEPLGIGCVLSAPVRYGGRSRAVLWAEDAVRDQAWADTALPFLGGVANLLGLRLEGVRDEQQDAAMPATHPAPAPPSPADTAVLPERFRSALHQAGIEEARLRRLREATGGEESRSAADLHEHVSVLVLLLDEPTAWVRAGEGDGAPSHVDALVRHLHERAEALGVAYVKTLGERVVCAAGFDGDAREGAEAIATLAGDLESQCAHRVGARDHRPPFRMGMDTGPALGSALGERDWIYNLWGDAVAGAQAMAESAVPGTVQVSHGSYALLHDSHLFAHRGHYYLPGLGESSTYLLLGPQ